MKTGLRVGQPTWPGMGASELSGQRVSSDWTDSEAEVLLEQLEYLIRYADQEWDRLARVKAILMETFN